MVSDEALQRQKEYLKRRRKATRIGMKKLERREAKQAAKEEDEINRRPYHSFEAVEITKRKNTTEDPYDVEAMFL